MSYKFMKCVGNICFLHLINDNCCESSKLHCLATALITLKASPTIFSKNLKKSFLVGAKETCNSL